MNGNLNRKQLLLYLIALVLLHTTEIPGGALLAVFCYFQMNLLFYKVSFTKKNQWYVTKIFLFMIPLFLFWGGILSLTNLYFKESHWLFLVGASLVTLSMTLFAYSIIQSVFLALSQESAETELQASQLRLVFSSQKKSILFVGAAIWILSQIPLFSSDWMIVWSLVLTQFMVQHQRLKQAFLT